MTRRESDKLLIELLAKQVDAGDGDGMSAARIAEALTTGPAFSEAESRSLWRSPIARDRLLAARERLRDQVLERWRTAGIVPEAELRAAAGEGTGATTVQGDDFTLKIFPEADPDMPWILSLQIGPRLRENWPAGLRFQLVDTGGLVWLTGRPNSKGEINDGWYDTSDTPQGRLLSHRLRLTPI